MDMDSRVVEKQAIKKYYNNLVDHSKRIWEMLDNQKEMVIRMEKGDPVVITDNLSGDMMPPPPPPPPPFHVKSFRVTADDPYAHDPANADIVSYEKKDIGKGLEKITIVRKKHDTTLEQKTVTVKVDSSDEKK